MEVRDEAYLNAFVCAGFAMGGVNKAEGRFFIHDTLAREVSSNLPDTDAEVVARMRQRMVNLERRDERLTEMLKRAQAERRLGQPRWRTTLRRVAPPALRPVGRRVIDKLTRNGRPAVTKVERRGTD
jgi:hypothetical protein